MTTEPCEDCRQAALTVWHSFRANCPGCAARAVARGPNYRRARDAGKQDRRYRSELEQYGVTHGEVKAAAQADQLQREVRS